MQKFTLIIKKILLTVCFIVITTSSFSQLIQKANRLHVGDINPAGAIDPSAALDVSSTTKGFLPPRMTNSQMSSITTPAVGLVVYCTDCNPEGLYTYKSGSGFNALTNASTITGFKVEKNTSFPLISGGKKVITAYDTTILNTGNNFDLITGLYTVPVDGIYLVNGILNLDGGDGNGDTMYMYFDKNGVTDTFITINPRFDTTNVIEAAYTLSTIMSLSAGDVIRLSYGDVDTSNIVDSFKVSFYATLIGG